MFFFTGRLKNYEAKKRNSNYSGPQRKAGSALGIEGSCAGPGRAGPCAARGRHAGAPPPASRRERDAEGSAGRDGDTGGRSAGFTAFYSFYRWAVTHRVKFNKLVLCQEASPPSPPLHRGSGAAKDCPVGSFGTMCRSSLYPLGGRGYSCGSAHEIM